MNRQQYMLELEKHLKTRQIEDITDILSDYDQHFAFKLADGSNDATDAGSKFYSFTVY